MRFLRVLLRSLKLAMNTGTSLLKASGKSITAYEGQRKECLRKAIESHIEEHDWYK